MSDRITTAYATFAGEINADAIKRILSYIAYCTQQNITSVHLLIHTLGGFVNEGVLLHNYFKTAPLELNFYNAGTVQSIGVTAFLGGARRFSSDTATFMIHKSHITPNAGTSLSPNSLVALADSLVADDIRTEGILKKHLTMPIDKWELHAQSNLYLTSADALAYGLIHEVRDFASPSGTQIANI